VAAAEVEAAGATDPETAFRSQYCFMELPVSESTAELSEEQRREIFHALVTAQDGGLSVRDSRHQTAAQFSISAEAVAQIEREGMDNEWPPL
jgi:hypothetical protein